jgi:predicted Ser/Thr protein kinase
VVTGIGERDGTPRLGAVTPLQPGDPAQVGRYVLSGRLGAGGMGTVYLARAAGGGPLVAVKVVHPELAVDPEFRARFADEVAAARRVAPFCTARVVDADTSARSPYLVTEFVDGVPLSEAVDEGRPLDESTLHGVALGVAAALSAVHAAGVVHRDLKPGNVLLSLSGPRVIDFGIAQALDVTRQHTQAGMLVGTPGWMAPEQFRGGSVGPPADVFSWGSLVAYAATGQNPWAAATSGPSLPPAEQAHRILHGTPTLDGLTGPLLRLVESALVKDPVRRPTARQLVDALLGGPAGGDPTRAAATALRRTWTALPLPPAGRPGGSGAGPAGRPGAAPPAARGVPDGVGSPVTRALPARRPDPTRVMPPAGAGPADGAGPPAPERRRPAPPPIPTVDVEPRPRRRRWYLRKRLLVPLGLLAVIALLSSRGDSTVPPSAGSQLNTPVQDGNLQFVVTQVRCGVTEVGGGLVKRNPKGQYCLAQVRVKNVKDDARTLYEPFQKLIDSAGDKHSADVSMRLVFRDQTLWDKVEPGRQVSGTMVFDIPLGVRAESLELHDGIASGGVAVRLR